MEHENTQSLNSKEGIARCLLMPQLGAAPLPPCCHQVSCTFSYTPSPEHFRWATKDEDKPQGRSHSHRDARLIRTVKILSVLLRQDWPSGNTATSVPPEISPTLPTKGKKPMSLQHDQGHLLPPQVSSPSGTNRTPGSPASCGQDKEVWDNVYGQQPGGSVVKKPTCQCQRLRSDPWVRKILRRRKWQPTGEFHGQRSLAGYGPRAHRKSDTSWWSSTTKTQSSGVSLKGRKALYLYLNLESLHF